MATGGMPKSVAMAALLAVCGASADARAQKGGFTLEQVLSAPIAATITAGPAGEFAWVSNARGRRNVWLARQRPGGDYESLPLTKYADDDGFVQGVEQSIYLADYHGATFAEAPVLLGSGHAPVAAPDGASALFLHHGEIMSVALQAGSKPSSCSRPAAWPIPCASRRMAGVWHS